METLASLDTFQHRLEARGLDQRNMDVDEVLEALLDFYALVRVDDADIESLGDMLGMEWGTHGKRDPAGLRFRYSLRRQMHIIGQDEGIWVLEFSYRCPPDAETDALRRGGRMCQAPEEADSFRAFVDVHPATEFVRSDPRPFDLAFHEVG